MNDWEQSRKRYKWCTRQSYVKVPVLTDITRSLDRSYESRTTTKLHAESKKGSTTPFKVEISPVQVLWGPTVTVLVG